MQLKYLTNYKKNGILQSMILESRQAGTVIILRRGQNKRLRIDLFRVTLTMMMRITWHMRTMQELRLSLVAKLLGKSGKTF